MNLMEAPYPWQKQQWQSLVSRVDQKQLPHALLLVGAKGLGKLQFAQRFSQFLLCQAEKSTQVACGSCKSCLLLKAQAHPDLVIIDEEDSGKIKMDAILELLIGLNKSSHQGSYKIAVISPAQFMNKSAANAILKTLEEPTPNTLLILLSDVPSLLPATLRSRCQMIKFSTLGYEYDKINLMQQVITQKMDAELLLRLADGAPWQAIHWLQNDILQQREQWLKDLFALQCNKLDPIALAAQYNQVELPNLLKWLTDCVIDLIRANFSLPQACMINLDVSAEIKNLSMQVTIKLLYQLLDRLMHLQRQLMVGINFNRQLLMESILCQWFALTQKGVEKHG